MSIVTKPLSRFGSDASYVEAVTSKGKARVDGRGQRLAILPIAIVARRLERLTGVLTPSQATDAEELLRALSDAGCAVASSSSASRTSSAAPA
jgi:aspartate-semialdehyde dehydrogenase